MLVAPNAVAPDEGGAAPNTEGEAALPKPPDEPPKTLVPLLATAAGAAEAFPNTDAEALLLLPNTDAVELPPAMLLPKAGGWPPVPPNADVPLLPKTEAVPAV